MIRFAMSAVALSLCLLSFGIGTQGRLLASVGHAKSARSNGRGYGTRPTESGNGRMSEIMRPALALPDHVAMNTSKAESGSLNISADTTNRTLKRSSSASANTSRKIEKRSQRASAWLTSITVKPTISAFRIGRQQTLKPSGSARCECGQGVVALQVDSPRPMSLLSMTASEGPASTVTTALPDAVSIWITTSHWQEADRTSHRTSFWPAHHAIEQKEPSSPVNSSLRRSDT